MTALAQDALPVYSDLELYASRNDLAELILEMWDLASQEESINQFVWSDVAARLKAIIIAIGSVNYQFKFLGELLLLRSVAIERLKLASKPKLEIV